MEPNTHVTWRMCRIDLNSVTSDTWNKTGGNSGTPNGATCSWKATGCFAMLWYDTHYLQVQSWKAVLIAWCLSWLRCLCNITRKWNPHESRGLEPCLATNAANKCPWVLPSSWGTCLFRLWQYIWLGEFQSMFDLSRMIPIVLIRIPCSPKLEAKIRAMGFWRSSRQFKMYVLGSILPLGANSLW